jgi:hypothetical protein
MRLFNYHLCTAWMAGQHLTVRIPAGVPKVNPDLPRFSADLSVPRNAMFWMPAERPNLRTAAGYASRCGLPAVASAIPSAVHGLMRAHGYHDQALSLYEVALDAARATGDQMAERQAP